MAAPDLDAIYTPTTIAAVLTEALPADLTGPVLDPAAGEGALLDSVVSRFGDSIVPLAIDVDSRITRWLLERRDWVVSSADTVRDSSRRASTAWREARKVVSAIVMNPPFSYRGNGGSVVSLYDFSGRVAPSVEFLAVVIRELRPTRGIWAILPDGALHAERHAGFWDAVRSRHSVEMVSHFDDHVFPGARVSTTLIHVGPVGSSKPVAAESRIGGVSTSVLQGCRCVEVIRGRVPVHRVADVRAPDGVRFLHTTDLSGRASDHRVMRVASPTLADDAPLILMSRIGRWISPMTVDVGRAVLSDCLFALRPRSASRMEILEQSLLENADEFSSRFRGTGAKYITVRDVVDALQGIGWNAIRVAASSPLGPCQCDYGVLHSRLSDGSVTR